MQDSVLLVAAVAALYTLIAVGWRLLSRVRMKMHWDAGRAALERGDLESAAVAYAKCVALEPMWAVARSMLAGTLARMGRGEEGEREARLVAEMNPRDPESWRALCMFYALFMPEREEETRAAFEELRRLDPAAADKFLRDPDIARRAPHLGAVLPPSGGGAPV